MRCDPNVFPDQIGERRLAYRFQCSRPVSEAVLSQAVCSALIVRWRKS